ncbi:MAG: NAD(P)H-dependent oxidoreductase [Desulfovibrio sp.]|jgi:chromate reductase|nr:NAD(P)H-dependent oxidoreductase [Desulfovibrio sp.]
MPKKAAIIIGSLRKNSLNRKLAQALANLAPNLLTFDIIPLDAVPMFNQDLEANLPEPVLRLKEQVNAVDGVLFVTPEYNRGMPAVLKNTVDWCSRPTGKGVLVGKAAAIAGISPGVIGTALAQSQLKPILLTLGMRLMGQPEIYIQGNDAYFDASGAIAEARNRNFLASFVSRFADWIG